MRHHFGKMETTVDRGKLMTTLRENRAAHAGIVAEARKEYMVKARSALRGRLEDLESGELVSLTFSLHPPRDYTEAYDTAISMLEWSTDDRVTLGADEFRRLVEDEWDWTDDFLMANSVYSASARDLSRSKGLI